MKLSTIALSMAVIVGAVATGGSWYTGKQIEQRYQELIAQGNQNLKELESAGIQAEIKNLKFERNFFSSTASYDFEIKAYGDRTYLLKGNDKVHHGPLPLNRLVKGNLVPVMASVDTILTAQESSDVKFEKTEVLVAQTAISYSSDLDGSFKTSAFKTNDMILEVSEIEVDFELDKLGTGAGSTTVKVPKLRVLDTDSDTEMSFNQMQYAITFPKEVREYPNLALGQAKVKMQSFVMRGMGNYKSTSEYLEVSDITGKTHNKVANAIYESEGDFSAKLAFGGQRDKRLELGKITADVFMKSDAKATDSLMKFTKMDPEQIQANDMMPNLEALTAKEIQLHLKDVAFENEKGKHSLSLAVNTRPFEFEKLQSIEDIVGLFKASTLDLAINIAAFETLLQQIEMMEDEADKESAEQAAKMATNELITQAQISRLFTVDPDNIKLKLEIDQGKVIFNGKEIPPEEIFITLLSLGLGFEFGK
ncbi:hypothetical protein A1D29_04175 [Pasteurellaceae bacterium Orientalotternb1]|nr:hypothetical protein A1D29_04175 [Pasteurellaceae bacterium Orientalotternb1]